MNKTLISALAVVSTAVSAAPWTQTGTSTDADGVKTTEFVAQNITRRGDIAEAYIRQVYSGDPLGPQSMIVNVEINCKEMTWGTVQMMAFAADGGPVLSSIGVFDTTKPKWTIKGAGRVDPTSTNYKSMEYVCAK